MYGPPLRLRLLPSGKHRTKNPTAYPPLRSPRRSTDAGILYTRKPISGEIAGSLGLYQNLHDGYNPRRAIDEALNYHVNYLMTLGWDITAFNLAKNPNVDSALYFYNQEYNRLIPYGLRWMGYRLVLTQAHFPGVAAPGETFTLIHAWENRAVGGCIGNIQQVSTCFGIMN